MKIDYRKINKSKPSKEDAYIILIKSKQYLSDYLEWYNIFLMDWIFVPYNIQDIFEFNVQDKIIYYNAELVKKAYYVNEGYIVYLLMIVVNHIVRSHYNLPDGVLTLRDRYIYNLSCEIVINYDLKISTIYDNISIIQHHDGIDLRIGKQSFWLSGIFESSIYLFHYLKKLLSNTDFVFKDKRSFYINSQLPYTVSYSKDAPLYLVKFVKQDQQNKIRSYIRKIYNYLMDTYKTWYKPPRWYIGKFLFQGNKKDSIKTCVVCIDISSSMSMGEVNLAYQAINMLIKDFDIECIFFNDNIVEHNKYLPGKFVDCIGGKTSYIILWRYLKQKGLLKKPIIIITDGLSTYPDSKKKDVWWLMTKPNKAPFGYNIYIGENNELV